MGQNCRAFPIIRPRLLCNIPVRTGRIKSIKSLRLSREQPSENDTKRFIPRGGTNHQSLHLRAFESLRIKLLSLLCSARRRNIENCEVGTRNWSALKLNDESCSLLSGSVSRSKQHVAASRTLREPRSHRQGSVRASAAQPQVVDAVERLGLRKPLRI